MSNGIYLHVLDRELQKTLDRPMSEELLLELMRISLLSVRQIYVSFSHICESSDQYPRVTSVLLGLQECGEIDFLLADREVGAFYAKRQKRYFFDKERYPFYFEKERMIQPSSDCIPKETSSTEYIRRRLYEVRDGDLRVRSLNAAKNPYIREMLESDFPDDPMIALTIRAFEQAFSDKKFSKEMLSGKQCGRPARIWSMPFLIFTVPVH